MARRKKKNNITKIIYIIYLILSLITLGIVLFLKVLPFKYTCILLSVYGIITLVFGILSRKNNNKASGILIIFILLFGMIFYYLNKTLNFMDLIGAKDYQIEEYYVLVLNDTKYNNINDLKDKEIAIYPGAENYTKALNELSKKINYKEDRYDNYAKLADALLDKDVEAIFISSIYKTILDDNIDDFNNDTKILETISIKIKNEVIVDNIDITKEPFNIYISGIDIYGDISLVSRSDVNMIATINPNTNKILLTSIPRDYYVRLHDTTGYKDKLTHAGLYGINTSIETLEDLMDININYYIRVNFTTLISLVDSIGGIDVYSDKQFTAYTNKNCKYEVGMNHLNGECALAFSRERYAYQEGDRHRVENQQNVISAILNKTLSSSTIITKYIEILSSLGNSFQTNMPKDKIYSLINMQLDNMKKWDIESNSLNGYDSYNYTYSYNSGKLYVMEPDMTTVALATNKIKEMLK